MKKMIILVIFICVAQSFSAQSTDAMEIEKTCNNYLDGFYHGDEEKIKKCLLPRIYKFGFWKKEDSGKYFPEGQMTFDQALAYARKIKEKGLSSKKMKIRDVRVLDVSNHTAVAKITAWWGIDYALLSRQEDLWMIEEVLWEGPLD